MPYVPGMTKAEKRKPQKRYEACAKALREAMARMRTINPHRWRTDASFADHIGVSPQLFGAWVKGIHWPPPGEKRRNLCAKLGVTLEKLTPSDEQLSTENVHDVNDFHEKESQPSGAVNGDVSSGGGNMLLELTLEVGALRNQVAELRQAVKAMQIELGTHPRKARK